MWGFIRRKWSYANGGNPFLRLRRLCSDDSDFSEKSETICSFSINVAILLLSFKRATTVHNKLVSVLFFSGGEKDYPLVFPGYYQGNRFKIGKMYEALTAMVFNRLL